MPGNSGLLQYLFAQQRFQQFLRQLAGFTSSPYYSGSPMEGYGGPRVPGPPSTRRSPTPPYRGPGAFDMGYGPSLFNWQSPPWPGQYNDGGGGAGPVLSPPRPNPNYIPRPPGTPEPIPQGHPPGLGIVDTGNPTDDGSSSLVRTGSPLLNSGTLLDRALKYGGVVGLGLGSDPYNMY